MNAATATAVRGYDPFDYAIHEDPYRRTRGCATHAPLYRNDERDFWALSRHADVVERCATRAVLQPQRHLARARPVGAARGQDQLLPRDGPARSRRDAPSLRAPCSRRAGSRPWRAGSASWPAPGSRRCATERRFDFAADYAAALPNDVMCEMVGVPAADRDRIRADTDLLNQCEDGVRASRPRPGGRGAAARLVLRGAGRGRRKRPRDDLTSAMIQARRRRRAALTDAQVVAFLFLMVSAGNESTGKLIGNALYHGWRLPDVQQAGLDGRAGGVGAARRCATTRRAR